MSREATGTRAATGDLFQVDVRGLSWAAFIISGSGTSTLVFEQSVDGVTWFNIGVTSPDTRMDTLPVTSSTATEDILAGPINANLVRVRMSLFSSGTKTVQAIFSQQAPSFDILKRTVEGLNPHDSAFPRPLGVGFRANADEPSPVSADDDNVAAWADRFGRLVTVDGHPNPETPIVVDSNANATAKEVIATPGASLSLYIQKAVVSVLIAADGTFELNSEGGSAVAGGVTDTVGMVYPFDFGARGWKVTANKALEVIATTVAQVRVSVTQYYIAA